MSSAITDTLNELADEFDLLGDWEERYRYVIELGKDLAPLTDDEHSDANKVRGCASQVWLETHVDKDDTGAPHLTFLGDSDAHIVRGLVALTLAIFSGQTARAILEADAHAVFDRLGLGAHLTPQRSNGFASMVNRVRAEASAAEAAKAS